MQLVCLVVTICQASEIALSCVACTVLISGRGCRQRRSCRKSWGHLGKPQFLSRPLPSQNFCKSIQRRCLWHCSKLGGLTSIMSFTRSMISRCHQLWCHFTKVNARWYSHWLCFMLCRYWEKWLPMLSLSNTCWSRTRGCSTWPSRKQPTQEYLWPGQFPLDVDSIR